MGFIWLEVRHIQPLGYTPKLDRGKRCDFSETHQKNFIYNIVCSISLDLLFSFFTTPTDLSERLSSIFKGICLEMYKSLVNGG